jgi:hypothetical protein
VASTAAETKGRPMSCGATRSWVLKTEGEELRTYRHNLCLSIRIFIDIFLREHRQVSNSKQPGFMLYATNYLLSYLLNLPSKSNHYDYKIINVFYS